MMLRLRTFVDLILDLTFLRVELLESWNKILICIYVLLQNVFVKPIIRTFSTR